MALQSNPTSKWLVQWTYPKSITLDDINALFTRYEELSTSSKCGASATYFKDGGENVRTFSTTHRAEYGSLDPKRFDPTKMVFRPDGRVTIIDSKDNRAYILSNYTKVHPGDYIQTLMITKDCCGSFYQWDYIGKCFN